MVLGPSCAGCARDPRRPAQCPGRGDRWGGGASHDGCCPFLPRTPGPFNKSFNSQKSLHTFTHSYLELLRGVVGRVHLALVIQPPAEGVAGAEELPCAGWKVKMMPQRGCLIQKTCKIPQKVISK